MPNAPRRAAAPRRAQRGAYIRLGEDTVTPPRQAATAEPTRPGFAKWGIGFARGALRETGTPGLGLAAGSGDRSAAAWFREVRGRPSERYTSRTCACVVGSLAAAPTRPGFAKWGIGFARGALRETGTSGLGLAAGSGDRSAAAWFREVRGMPSERYTSRTCACAVGPLAAAPTRPGFAKWGIGFAGGALRETGTPWGVAVGRFAGGGRRTLVSRSEFRRGPPVKSAGAGGRPRCRRRGQAVRSRHQVSTGAALAPVRAGPHRGVGVPAERPLGASAFRLAGRRAGWLPGQQSGRRTGAAPCGTRASPPALGGGDHQRCRLP